MYILVPGMPYYGWYCNLQRILKYKLKQTNVKWKRWQIFTRRQRYLHNHKLDKKRDKNPSEALPFEPHIQICLIPVTDTSSSSVWEAKNIFSSEITIFFVCTAGTLKRVFHISISFSSSRHQIKYMACLDTELVG